MDRLFNQSRSKIIYTKTKGILYYNEKGNFNYDGMKIVRMLMQVLHQQSTTRQIMCRIL